MATVTPNLGLRKPDGGDLASVVTDLNQNWDVVDQAASAAVFTAAAFGATGDGSTDDSAALQAMLDAVAAKGGGTADIGPGTYCIGTALQIKAPGNIWLRMAPNAIIRRINTGTPPQYMLRNFSGASTDTGYDGVGNIHITGGTFDADGATQTSLCTSLIFAHTLNLMIDDVTVINGSGWHAIEINSSKNVTVRHSRFEGYAINSGEAFSEAVQIDGAFGAGPLPDGGAYDNTMCTNVLITGCSVTGRGSLGSYGKLCGSHSTYDGLAHAGIRVLGNYAEDLNDYGVRMYGWQDSIVAENVFKHCNGGVLADMPGSTTAVPMFGLTIANNVFEDMGQINNGASICGYLISATGLDAASTTNVPLYNVQIRGNTFRTWKTANGILAVNIGDLIVTGNDLRDGGSAATGDGITVQDSYGAMVTDNRMSTLPGNGIRIENLGNVSALSSNQAQVSGNNITSSGSNGIRTAGNANVMINNNTLRGCGASGTSSIRVTVNVPGTGSTYAIAVGNHITKGSATADNAIYCGSGSSVMASANFIQGWGTSTTIASGNPYGGTSGSYIAGSYPTNYTNGLLNYCV